MSFLPLPLYTEIERSMPIACVDFVPFREAGGVTEVGLILRESPFGRVWCHLGGRVLRGETIRQAIVRHTDDTLGVDVVLPVQPQPDFVYEWFPDDIAPDDGTPHGVDPRKHAIGLSFAVSFEGEPRARNEALAFRYVAIDALPEAIWPGSETLVAELERRRR